MYLYERYKRLSPTVEASPYHLACLRSTGPRLPPRVPILHNSIALPTSQCSWLCFRLPLLAALVHQRKADFLPCVSLSNQWPYAGIRSVPPSGLPWLAGAAFISACTVGAEVDAVVATRGSQPSNRAPRLGASPKCHIVIPYRQCRTRRRLLRYGYMTRPHITAAARSHAARPTPHPQQFQWPYPMPANLRRRRYHLLAISAS